MSDIKRTGTLNIEYAKGRESKRSLRYRLWRRTYEVLKAMEQFASLPIQNVLDLGTADGRMLNTIQREYPNARCVGVEFDEDLVAFAKTTFPALEIIQGDVCSLEFPDRTFDVAIATAIIEHIPSPGKMLEEARRVLKSGGFLVMTAPDPFWEHIATRVGHLDEEMHQNVMNLQQLQHIARESGFTVLKAEKFMLSPIGMPFEFPVEKVFRTLGLNFLMANQLLVIRN